MKRILWVSEHDILPIQRPALRRLFAADVRIMKIPPSAMEDARAIRDYFRAGGYDDLIMVAPLSLVADLYELGLTPLWPTMGVARPGRRRDLVFRDVAYRFSRYQRVVDADDNYLVLKELGPLAVRLPGDELLTGFATRGAVRPFEPSAAYRPYQPSRKGS